MFKTFKDAWKVAELRKKILFTLFILIVFRIGCRVPVPFIDDSIYTRFNADGGAFSYLNMISGSALSNGTLFALSISPYITAQIIIQLLTIAIPALERLSKQGEEGQRKIQSYTRYGTVILAVITAIGYYALLDSDRLGVIAVIIVAAYTAGASLVMWLAEKINEHGIGNGISILLFAGIVSGMPTMFVNLIFPNEAYGNGVEYEIWQQILLIVGTLVVIIALIAFIVFVTESERRLPVQYAKKVVGRKMYGGQNSALPIKLNMSGVMPFIFAQSIMSIPETIRMIAQPTSKFWVGFFNIFSTSHPVYIIILFALIIAFAYFYLAISFNPVEVANNLKKNGGTVFGIRPGKPTSDYIGKVVRRITLIGALFLAIVAILPMILSNVEMFRSLSLGGTSLLIAVGVALELERELEAQMSMRNYKGFLE